MMLGKRQRPPLKRTTSLSEITFDLNTPVEAPPSDLQRQATGYGNSDQRLSLPVASSPRIRRHSVDFSDNGGQFLRSCALCKRRLVPSRDIYMYRYFSIYRILFTILLPSVHSFSESRFYSLLHMHQAMTYELRDLSIYLRYIIALSF